MRAITMDNNTKHFVEGLLFVILIFIIVAPISFCTYKSNESDNLLYIEIEKTKQLEIKSKNKEI